MATTTGAPLTDDDMELMRILHDAFRRDAARLAKAAERYGTTDPETHDALLIGWHGFSRSLHHHHTIEDNHIWPALRAKLTDRPDDEAVLDDMESEHALIDPALEAVEKAFDDAEAERDEVAGRIDELLRLLHGHLGHEEGDAFPLMRGWLTTEEWAAMNKASMKELPLSELAALGPFILDGASPDDVRRVLSEFPAPLRLVHRFWWEPRYRKVRRWE